ncbi:MAG: hypothetical protein OXU79_13875 [Gemmatimonadota bacterium]|nr:hypothetical protein [Gemmatimonadota bacterium]
MAALNTRGFSIAEALRFGWRTTLDNLGYFLSIGLLYLVITLGLNGAVYKVNAYSEAWAFLAGIVALVAGMIMDVGLAVISLRFAGGRRAGVADLFIHYHLAPIYFISTLTATLMVVAGLALLIVPGIFLLVLFQFYALHIVDEGAGAVAALRRSAALTRGERWRLFLFGLLTVLINVGGALCLLVGLFLSVPMTLISRAYIFRKLQAAGPRVDEMNESGV